MAALQANQPAITGMYKDLYQSFMPAGLKAAEASGLAQLQADDQLSFSRFGERTVHDLPRLQVCTEAYLKRVRALARHTDTDLGTPQVQAALQAQRPVTEMVAVNHWRRAVETHRKNYPWATVLQEDVSRVDPRPLLGGKRVHLGVAGPSCTHFTHAGGGMPVTDQERSHAWDVTRWARHLEPENLIIENVPEFATWGRLRHKRDKKTGELLYRKTGDPWMEPDPAYKGEYFREFLALLKRLGYNVDWRVLCAAHYGDPTTRRRLFVQARRGRVTWPEPTHRLRNEQADLFDLPIARPVRDILDWNLPPGESIFTRKKPLKPNTMRRIMQGLERFLGRPFIVPQLLGARVRGLDEPMNTIMSTGTGNALIEPYLVGIGGPIGRQVPSSIGEPLGTILSQNHTHVVTPYLLRYNDGGRIESVDAPLTTVDGSNRFALIEPFLISYYGNGGAHSLADGLPTITGKDRFALVEAIGTALEQGVAVVVDIRMRMLQPHELAAAHSFPADYQFCGGKGDAVKMIGNSWPVATAQALCREVVA